MAGGNTAAAVQMNQPGFCEALSACCCHVTHGELNVMPKGRVCEFDKVGCLLPTWVLSDTARTGPGLESHTAAASQLFRRGRQDSASPFLVAFRDSTAR